MSPEYDAFLSYSHRDDEPVSRLGRALAAAGLSVWLDAVIDYDFESITRAVENGLANSRALIAYYSRAYVASRACQWELTAAFLAGQRAGDPLSRILVLNPEPTRSS